MTTNLSTLNILLRRPGVLAALSAALLFGSATPLAKRLLQTVDAWLLAGLLYLGAGLGLLIYRRIVRSPSVRMSRSEFWWFAAAISAGGIVAPVLLMFGLARTPASAASLLLNAEAAFTALLAWFLFKENFNRRIAFGLALIIVGAAVLSVKNGLRLTDLWASVAILGACMAWGIDNNLTRKVSLNDASWIACIKGLVAGTVNVMLAIGLGARMPSIANVTSAMVIGFLANGVSLTLFVVALRHLGAARTGAYFSVAPFFGAVFAIFLGDAITPQLIAAAALMAAGVWLHLTESHEHEHSHEPLEHEHEHTHGDDPHHEHEHDEAVAAGTRHTHRHRHVALRHTHAHFPDSHHQHEH
jgi:drug/metabolite transporter (DMT)-like permease